MTTVNPVTLPTIPEPLHWDAAPAHWHMAADGALAIGAGERTDLFVDPGGTAVTLNAPRLLFQPGGDFVLSAQVQVDFASTYDAGVLLLYSDQRTWAKLCFEFSPQRQPMIVSVVTREYSDDCNSFVVDGNQVWLRIARMGQAFAFHASTDGAFWHFIRHFSLSAPSVAAGFSSQSPTGQGCVSTFTQIAYAQQTLGDLRSGE